MATAMIGPERLISLRNEYSLISCGARCFAILWSNSHFHSQLGELVRKINKYNPHRVYLQLLKLHHGPTPRPFAVVEMKYGSPIHQKYFTYLMWLFSHQVDMWIHMWDTLEHDVLRRDFSAPSEMDAELSINRLWLHNRSVFLLRNGYTDDNPHGEYVPELDLKAAMDALMALAATRQDSLTRQLSSSFGKREDHLIENVLDIQNVYIPKSLVNLVLHHPHWVTRPEANKIDLTDILLDCFPESLLLVDEEAYTVAVSDTSEDRDALDKLFPDSLTDAQWISLSIKINANDAFAAAKQDTGKKARLDALVAQPIPRADFHSSFLMSKLYELGLSTRKSAAKLVCCPDLQMKTQANVPLRVLSESDRQKYEKLQRRDFLAEESESDSGDREMEDAERGETNIFTSLEDSKEFARYFSRKDLTTKLSAALEDPDLLGGAQALTEEDLQQTEKLEDFDDFVEYYAKHFLGYSDADLMKHKVRGQGDERTDSLGQDGSRAETASFDWSKYNDDSDYESDYLSEEDVGI
ncbi:hypothetical protein METBIDRAFT_97221 [Metschnikowia bicuspidata var. bicuspidata NRRL YB-4993]|uniref:Uncharacterized protein n=1 Tax=Metschnikowia bicuspidata var. bicuspidata NRRL YB-4993 TaxID=869754 RepID=A0A1A0HGS3_9ASCO|nr:hypothetical protein METBIDRAFT_97221 [Metschnikowia bicuspidata var. bicuspidata NRRL YB-4993]OBA23053.1 hypothetical protein METBIDRAFT_97221 [Metschnikowia bicuspidata var. bicuspidata NRRL YB-4993]